MGSEKSVTIRHDVMALLANREHTAYELIRKLRAQGHQAELIQAVLEDLIAEGVQSDHRFVEGYVFYRANKGFGPTRIRLELQERGVDEALIAQFVDDSDSMWLDLLSQQHQKHFKGQLPENYAERAKQMRFLQYRGFTSRQIHQYFAEYAGNFAEQLV